MKIMVEPFPKPRPEFTPRARKIVGLAVRAALEQGHPFVGAEHLLAGILMEGESIAFHVVSDAGITWMGLRAKLGWKTPGELQESNERALYLRLKQKFEPS